jgi:hypothetical protein
VEKPGHFSAAINSLRSGEVCGYGVAGLVSIDLDFPHMSLDNPFGVVSRDDAHAAPILYAFLQSMSVMAGRRGYFRLLCPFLKSAGSERS